MSSLHDQSASKQQVPHCWRKESSQNITGHGGIPRSGKNQSSVTL